MYQKISISSKFRKFELSIHQKILKSFPQTYHNNFQHWY